MALPDAITSIFPAAKSQSLQRASSTRPRPESRALPGCRVAHQKGLHNVSHCRHGKRKTVSYVQPVGAS
eukprot:364810-Chlamydomonas_euryale.AAC.8